MGRWTTEGHEGTFWGDGNVRYFDCGDGSQLCTFAKTQQTVHFTRTFTICKFSLNKHDFYKNSTKNLCENVEKW